MSFQDGNTLQPSELALGLDTCKTPKSGAGIKWETVIIFET